MNNANLKILLANTPGPAKEFAKILSAINIDKVLNEYNNVTVLIPSHEMIKEINSLEKNEKLRKVLSLIIPSKITHPHEWQNKKTLCKTNVPSMKIKHSKIEFDGKGSAQLIKTANKYTLWEMSGSHVPVPAKTGSFENKETKVEASKISGLIKKLLTKENGIVQAVADIYNVLDEENKKKADNFINGNPYADFWLLYDSPFITYDEMQVESTSVENAQEYYDRIVRKKGEFLVNNGDVEKLNKLRESVEDGGFWENKYKSFYEHVAQNGGICELDGESIQFCHPELAPYLFSLEIFYVTMKRIGEEFEKAAPEEKQNYITQMIAFNQCSNVKTLSHSLFNDTIDQDLKDSNIDYFNDFKKIFEKCGFCFAKKSVVESEISGGDEELEIFGAGSRKVVKAKRKLSKLSSEEKKKLIQFLSK